MAVKSFSKEVFLLPFCIILLLVTDKFNAIANCDRRLMNEFGLSGMKIALANDMKVCGHVKDKCCTITDEIRIYKLWNTYTFPFLLRHSSSYMVSMRRIVDSLFTLMKIDPRLIVLKHVVRKEIPYSYDVCSSRQHPETPEEHKEFTDFHDARLEYELAPSFYRLASNKGKSFDIKKHTHDKNGDRHWNIKYPANHIKMEKKMLNDFKISLKMPALESTLLTCNKASHTYNKEYIVVNEKKADFCLSLYNKFLNLNIRHLKKYLVSVKNDLTQIHNYKSSLYCMICNAHEQRYIDPKKKSITLSRQFCQSLLKDKESYFRFVHILLIEFMDSLLQYVQCFETDAKVYTFPFTNLLIKYKRRIPFVKSCLDSIETQNFYTYCWFICDQFDMMKVIPFFDGDAKLLRRVQIAIFSFLRKLRISKKQYKKTKNKPFLLTKKNVNGMLIEPLNPSHLHTRKFYLEKEDRLKLLGKLDTRPKLANKKSEKMLDKFLGTLGFGNMNELKKLKKDHKKLIKKNKKDAKKFEKVLNMGTLTEREKKKMEKEKKYFRNKYSRVNDLYNFLWKVKLKSKLHSGFFPQRKLIEDPEIKSKLIETFVGMGLDRGLVDKKIEKVSKETNATQANNSTNNSKLNNTTTDKFIEDPSQVFEKNKKGYDVKEFKLVLEEEGPNPINNFILVDYKFNITKVIGLQFKNEEDLDRDTVLTYLKNTPKDINEFNFDAKTYFMGYREVGGDGKHIAAKKILKYAGKHGRVQLAGLARKRIRKFEHRMHKKIKATKDAKALKKFKKKVRGMRIDRMRNKKVIANHHIDFPHYKKNFFDIGGFFTNMFGP